MTAFPSRFNRAIVLVVDSLGICELPDAAAYGDQGSNTLANISRRVALEIPVLRALGIGRIARLHGMQPEDRPTAAFGRMAEASAGKDSVTGHWELMGLVVDKPFPVFPAGFPPQVLARFEERSGYKMLGNRAASGT